MSQFLGSSFVVLGFIHCTGCFLRCLLSLPPLFVLVFFFFTLAMYLLPLDPTPLVICLEKKNNSNKIGQNSANRRIFSLLRKWKISSIRIFFFFPTKQRRKERLRNIQENRARARTSSIGF